MPQAQQQNPRIYTNGQQQYQHTAPATAAPYPTYYSTAPGATQQGPQVTNGHSQPAQAGTATYSTALYPGTKPNGSSKPALQVSTSGLGNPGGLGPGYQNLSPYSLVQRTDPRALLWNRSPQTSNTAQNVPQGSVPTQPR